MNQMNRLNQLGLGSRRGGVNPGNLPATFTVGGGIATNTGTKRINFSEPTTVTVTGDVTLEIDGNTLNASNPTAEINPKGSHHEFTLTTDANGGTVTFGKRKQVTYLYLLSLGSTAITGDITGMGLEYLFLNAIGSALLTGDITGMGLTVLYLASLGGTVLTGDITGMGLEYLFLYSLGSSVITGNITGMRLTSLRLASLGSSSFTYGTNPFNINQTLGIQILQSDVFTDTEYRQLFIDAAAGTWSAGAKPFTIAGGDSPGYNGLDGQVKTAFDTLLDKKNNGQATITITVPEAWVTPAVYPNDFPATVSPTP
jgi:hypothetical protein